MRSLAPPPERPKTTSIRGLPAATPGTTPIPTLIERGTSIHGLGVEESLARFARTHASWDAADIGIDDLLVSLADKIWKAKRVPDLEHLVVDRLAAATGRQPWEMFMALDDVLGRIAQGADQRLAFQSSYPI